METEEKVGHLLTAVVREACGTCGTALIDRLIGAVCELVAAERERCARVAEGYAAEKWTAYKHGRSPDRADPRAEGSSDGAEEVARRIRAGGA